MQISLGVLLTKVSELILLLTYCAAPESNCTAAEVELQEAVFQLQTTASNSPRPHLGYLCTLVDAFGVMKGRRLLRLARPDMDVVLDALRENFIAIPERNMWEVRYVIRRVQSATSREMSVLVQALESYHRSNDIVMRVIKVRSVFRLRMRRVLYTSIQVRLQ
jgi:hypothetical protein